MRVLLLRADASSPNLGVRALKEGTESLVKQAWGSDTVVHVQNFDGGDTGQRFNRSAVLRDIGRRNGPIKTVVRKYDAVIDVCGGDSFTDIYGLKRLALILYTQHSSQKLGVPTLMGPQTIGPFERPHARIFAAKMLRRMELVISRDSASAAEAQALGRPADVAGTDVVFALPVPSPRRRRGVVVNVSGLLWRENPHVDHLRYQHAVRSLLRQHSERGEPVTLLPHVLDNPRPDNDVPVARQLASEFAGSRATVPESLVEAREIMAGAELVIGARMHACLNALSVGTPAIPWAYSRKFAPLMSDIGWPYLVDPRDDTDAAAHTMQIVRENPAAQLAAQVGNVRTATLSRLAAIVEALSEVRRTRG